MDNGENRRHRSGGFLFDGQPSRSLRPAFWGRWRRSAARCPPRVGLPALAAAAKHHQHTVFPSEFSPRNLSQCHFLPGVSLSRAPCHRSPLIQQARSTRTRRAESNPHKKNKAEKAHPKAQHVPQEPRRGRPHGPHRGAAAPRGRMRGQAGIGTGALRVPLAAPCPSHPNPEPEIAPPSPPFFCGPSPFFLSPLALFPPAPTMRPAPPIWAARQPRPHHYPFHNPRC